MVEKTYIVTTHGCKYFFFGFFGSNDENLSAPQKKNTKKTACVVTSIVKNKDTKIIVPGNKNTRWKMI